VTDINTLQISANGIKTAYIRKLVKENHQAQSKLNTLWQG